MNHEEAVSRRHFLKKVTVFGVAGLGSSALAGTCETPSTTTTGLRPELNVEALLIDDFNRADTPFHGTLWESMNPGYWSIQQGALRRRLRNEGDGKPTNWFPWHWETHRNAPIPITYDRSLPFGMLMRKDWHLRGNFSIQVDFTVEALPKNQGLSTDKQYEPGYGLFGIVFGSQCLHESWDGARAQPTGRLAGLGLGARPSVSWMTALTDDGQFGIFSHDADDLTPVVDEAETRISPLNPGDQATLQVSISGDDPDTATVTALLVTADRWAALPPFEAKRTEFTDGYFGLVARGLYDVSVQRVALVPGDNDRLEVPVSNLHVCYALGDSLEERDGTWYCKFIALLREDGNPVEIRIAPSENPPGGWENVATTASAPVVTNTFRQSTAVLYTPLPANPADSTLYYTVWQDGQNLTPDPRIGTDSSGPGTGFSGAVPASGQYVGRLPRLGAPYKICGLSCHGIHDTNAVYEGTHAFEPWYIHDLPTPAGFQHLEAFNFQIMLWEDDIWYLERVFAPPSRDDAYKVITTTIAGPTCRWQMMRHWNILNPGDHDFGMDDVKGPEQLLLRNREGLGQDPTYMRRNFQIVQHLISGDENPDAITNPKNWRRWRMPANDFSVYIMDARLWRSSQDTNIWDDEGWGGQSNLYDRTDPTRSLLGEEQFAWLERMLRTDASPLICVTGINALHTIWSGVKEDPSTGYLFDQRDRVTADYAGWVAAGANRILNILSARDGVVSVYGDVHNGCIIKNKDQRVVEACFGPIGRASGRRPKEDFGPDMMDYDNRPLDVIALYHAQYQDPNLTPNEGPFYWNFLEMAFDPRGENPSLFMKVRNLIDHPRDAERGGAPLEARASDLGRVPDCRLPRTRLFPNADVQIALMDGTPLRGTRTLSDGTLALRTLIGVPPETPLLVTARTANQTEARIIESLPL